MSRISFLAFDFDGVLYDSILESVRRMIRVAKESNLRGLTEEIILKEWGASLKDLASFFEKNCNWSSGCGEEFRKNLIKFEKNKKLFLFPGVREILSDLKSEFNLAMISNRDGKSLEKIFKKCPTLEEKFDLIINGDSLFKKPDFKSIEPLCNFMSQRRDNGDICIIGDTVKYDWELVRNCKVANGYKRNFYFIGVTSGLCFKENFLAVGVPKKCIIESVNDIFSALRYLKSI